MEFLFFVHFVTTLFMAAICWFVQLVHYPLFREINLADFPNYEKRNLFFTSYIAMPLMVVEGLTGLYLLYMHQDYIHFSNVLLLVVTGLSTFTFQAPIHLKLLVKPNDQLITRLIKSNWIRTISWSVRCGIVIYLIRNL